MEHSWHKSEQSWQKISREVSSPGGGDGFCCTKLVARAGWSPSDKRRASGARPKGQALSGLRANVRPASAAGGGGGARVLAFPLSACVEGRQFRDGPLQCQQGEDWIGVHVLLFVNGIYMFSQEMGAMRSFAWCPFSEVRGARYIRLAATPAEQSEMAMGADDYMELLPFHVHFYHEGQKIVLATTGVDAEEQRRRWIDDINMALRERASLLFPARPPGMPVDVRPLEDVPHTGSRILAGFLLHTCYDRPYDPVLMLYCELRAHCGGSAMFVMYTDESCREVYDGIVLTGSNINNELRKDGDVGFIIQRHRFRVRSTQETKLWIRAIQNVCVKLVHAAPDPCEEELQQFRAAVMERAQELEQEAEENAGVGGQEMGSSVRFISQPAPIVGRCRAPVQQQQHTVAWRTHAQQQRAAKVTVGGQADRFQSPIGRGGAARPPQPLSPSTPNLSSPSGSPPSFSTISEAASVPLSVASPPPPASRSSPGTAVSGSSRGGGGGGGLSRSLVIAGGRSIDAAPELATPPTVLAASCGGREGLGPIQVDGGRDAEGQDVAERRSCRKRSHSCPAQPPHGVGWEAGFAGRGDVLRTLLDAPPPPSRAPLYERLGLSDDQHGDGDGVFTSARTRRWSDFPRPTHGVGSCSPNARLFASATQVPEAFVADAKGAASSRASPLESPRCSPQNSPRSIPHGLDGGTGACAVAITDVSTGSGTGDSSSSSSGRVGRRRDCHAEARAEGSASKGIWSPAAQSSPFGSSSSATPRGSVCAWTPVAELATNPQMQPTASPSAPSLSPWLISAPTVYGCDQYEVQECASRGSDADDDEAARPAIPCARQAWPGLDRRSPRRANNPLSNFWTPPRTTRSAKVRSAASRGDPRTAPPVACVLTPPSPPLFETISPKKSPARLPAVQEDQVEREASRRDCSEADPFIRAANGKTAGLVFGERLVPADPFGPPVSVDRGRPVKM